MRDIAIRALKTFAQAFAATALMTFTAAGALPSTISGWEALGISAATAGLAAGLSALQNTFFRPKASA